MLNSSICEWARVSCKNLRRATIRLLRSISSSSVSLSMSIFIRGAFRNDEPETRSRAHDSVTPNADHQRRANATPAKYEVAKPRVPCIALLAFQRSIGEVNAPEE